MFRSVWVLFLSPYLLMRPIISTTASNSSSVPPPSQILCISVETISIKRDESESTRKIKWQYHWKLYEKNRGRVKKNSFSYMYFFSVYFPWFAVTFWLALVKGHYGNCQELSLNALWIKVCKKNWGKPEEGNISEKRMMDDDLPPCLVPFPLFVCRMPL